MGVMHREVGGKAFWRDTGDATLNDQGKRAEDECRKRAGDRSRFAKPAPYVLMVRKGLKKECSIAGAPRAAEVSALFLPSRNGVSVSVT